MSKARIHFSVPVLLLLVRISVKLAAKDEKSPNSGGIYENEK
jgi:hypothetical protein